MTVGHFKKCIRGVGLDTHKKRGLEVLEVFDDNAPILTIRYQDIHSITSFREWFNHEFREEYIPPLG